MFGPFRVPEAVARDDGWEEYRSPVRIDSRSAQFLYPGDDTPEAAVVHFYASLIRRDDEYRAVLPDRWSAPAVLERKLQMLTAWTFLDVELLGRKVRGRSSLYVRIRARILIDGVVHTHTDEVTLRRQDDGSWLVVRPPT